MQTFAVTVPAGVGPGQQFQASLDGQLRMVIVPRGSGPSSTLHVQIPARPHTHGPPTVAALLGVSVVPADDLLTDDLLSALPLELQVHIAQAVDERCDRAALALASPRLLGLAACRELPSYQGLEMSLAFYHVLGGAIDEQVLRRYASHAEATLGGCGWLTGVAAATGLRTLRLTGSGPGPGPGPGPGSVREATVKGMLAAREWYLMQPDSTVGALLRFEVHQWTRHYEGAEGAERLVRSDLAHCVFPGVFHFEGEKDAERRVRNERPNGDVSHYEGEQGVERMVRHERPNGVVLHYEGEKGTERLVRQERPVPGPSGDVLHYEGEKGVERMVRMERPSGDVLHYNGEKDAERLVRMERPSGDVLHYNGEKGVERMVRHEREWGVHMVEHYEGERNAERMVRVGLAFGVSISLHGERGRERPKATFANLVVVAIVRFIAYVCRPRLPARSAVRHS